MYRCHAMRQTHTTTETTRTEMVVGLDHAYTPAEAWLVMKMGKVTPAKIRIAPMKSRLQILKFARGLLWASFSRQSSISNRRATKAHGPLEKYQ